MKITRILTAVILSLAMLASLCACTVNKGETETAAETAAETTAAATEALSYGTGMYEILAKYNEDVDLRGTFGSSIDNGAQMTIGPDGYFDFDIGATGGTGTYTAEGNVLNVTYTDRQEGEEQTCSLTWDGTFYEMSIADTVVVWSLTQESDGGIGVEDGTYYDSTSGRATAEVETDGDTATITVDWGNSASETYEWTMTVSQDGDGKLVYSDCTKSIVADTGTTTEYTDGEGYFEITDAGALAWTGAQDENCQACVFENPDSIQE